MLIPDSVSVPVPVLTSEPPTVAVGTEGCTRCTPCRRTAVADHTAHRRAQVVAANGELARAEIDIARSRDRAGAELAITGNAGARREIDRAAGVVEKDGGVTSRAVVEEREFGASIVGDRRALPAVALVSNTNWPLLKMLALPAVLESANTSRR